MRIAAIVMLALMLLIDAYGQSDSAEARAIYDMALSHFRRDEIPEGMVYLESALQAFRSNGDHYHEVSAENDRIKALEFLGMNRLEVLLAFEHIEKELLPLVEKKGEVHAKTYYNIGNAHYYMGQLGLARQYLLRAEELMKRTPEKSGYQLAMIMVCLADIDVAMGNTNYSITTRRKALQLYEEVLGPYHPYAALQWIMLAESLLDNERLKELEEVRTDLELVKANMGEEYKETWADMRLFEVRYTAAQGNFAEALGLLSKLEKDYPDYSRYLLNKYRMLTLRAEYLGEIGRHDEAETILLAALADPAAYGKEGTLYHALINHYLGRNLPGKALHYAKLSESTILPEKGQDVRSMWDFRRGIGYALNVYRLKVQATLAYADSSDAIKDKVAVLSAVEEAELMFNYARRKAKVGELIYLRKGGWFTVYEIGMQTALALYKETGDEAYIEAAWTIAENAKAAGLLGSVNRTLPGTEFNVPAALVVKEKALKTEIAYFELIDSESSLSFAQHDSLVQLNRSLDSLIMRYEQDFPEYTSRRFSPEPVTFRAAREALTSSSTAMISYFFGESQVYGIGLSANGVEFQDLGSASDLTTAVSDYRLILGTMPQIDKFRSQLDELTRRGKLLHQQLLKPFEAIVKGHESLLVISDGPLNYVPLESLPLSASQGDARLKYMIDSYQITYAYSYTSLQATAAAALDFPMGLMAIAPDFERSSTSDARGNDWNPIPGARREVEQVSTLFTKKQVRTSAENFEWFLANKGRHQVIHLATHAYVNEDEPFRSGLLLDAGPEAGRQGVLHVEDLYSMSIPAGLVVLSACNTGFGKVQKGEGVVSLAHAFSHAGASSVMMTMWPANDAATLSLITNFYEKLQGGHSKSASLTAAKRQYLSDSDAFRSHPYFWSGMVFVGLDTPLSGSATGSKQYAYLWLLLLPVVVFGGYRIIRRGRQGH